MGSRATSTIAQRIEGRDFIVLERVRLLDQMGFEQPVEAVSVLAPREWTTQGGILWNTMSHCGGERVTFSMSSVSPDQSIRIDIYPARSFVWSDNRAAHQSLVAASKDGGCFVREPFTAAEYLERFAERELGFALVSEVRPDHALAVQAGHGVDATLSWPDGTRGLARIAVSSETLASPMRDMPIGTRVTSVFDQAVIRYRPEREAEALRLFATLLASRRVNPIWQQAKDDVLAQPGAAEPAGTLRRLRLPAEAYLTAFTLDDTRPRSWEIRDGAADRTHPQPPYIPKVREIEAWRDPGGEFLELSAGYSHAWRRADGAYLLTNDAEFDPCAEFDEDWTRMEKPSTAASRQ